MRLGLAGLQSISIKRRSVWTGPIRAAARLRSLCTGSVAQQTAEAKIFGLSHSYGITKAMIALIEIWFSVKVTFQASMYRNPRSRLFFAAGGVGAIRALVTNLARESGGNGSALVGYADIGVVTSALSRFLGFVNFFLRIAPTAAELAKQIDNLQYAGSLDIRDPALLLIQGRACLKRGDFAGAAAFARHALMIQAVCIDSQKLLFDTLTAARQHGDTTKPSDISIENLKGRFCSRPFTTLVSGSEGRTFICDCPAYVPIATGNLLYSEGAEDVWNSPVAQEIRRSVLDGDYSYCSRTLCGLIKEDLLPRNEDITDPALRDVIDNHLTKLEAGPSTVQLSHDPSCNLACPSCRSEIITLKNTELGTYEAARDRVVMPLLARTKGTVMLSGGGDPFASKHYRSILAGLNAETDKDLTIALLTNALVLTPKQWDEFKGAHPLIRSILVSVDAARPETYAYVRRPGNFTRLMPNLEFLAEQRRAGAFGLFGLCFVVQERNFREMPEFVELGKKLGVDAIWFQRLVNFGTFDEQGLRDADVGDPNHAHHEEFTQILQDPRLKDPSVHLFTAFLDR
jgi:molybdenum cofactor biosynthesis enzyme MoaA